MDYLFTFLEGIASFISPCMLPMLPIYISYFAGNKENKKSRTLFNSIGFVIGFTLVFILFSILASTFGNIVTGISKYVKVIFGILIIIIGLNYMSILNIKQVENKASVKDLNFFKALIFGIMFSISWTPCIGSFLTSALLLVAEKSTIIKGIVLMLLYSLGLGIPFIISAVIIDKLKNVFDFIKKNYNKFEKISGVILIIMGIYVIFF